MAASLAAKTRRSSGLLRCGFAGWGLLLVDAVVRNSGGRELPLPRRVHDDVPGGEGRSELRLYGVLRSSPTFEGCWLSVSSLMECRRTAESIIYIIMDPRNNRSHALLLDAVGQAVIATDPQGKVIYWNRAAQQLYGWSAEEAMGRPIMEITPSEDLMEQAEEIMTELMAGRSWTGEFVVRRKDGTTFPAMVTDTPVHDDRGALVAIFGVSTDITGLKQTEQLRRSEERFRSLVQNASDIILVMKADQTVQCVSPAVERILGYKPEEVVGTDNFGVVQPDDIARAQKRVTE